MGDDNSSDLFTRDVSAIFHYNSVRLEAGYSQTSWSHIAKDHQLFNTRAPLASLSTYNACGTFFCFSRYPRCYCCTLGPYPIALRQLEVVYYLCKFNKVLILYFTNRRQQFLFYTSKTFNLFLLTLSHCADLNSPNYISDKKWYYNDYQMYHVHTFYNFLSNVALVQ